MKKFISAVVVLVVVNTTSAFNYQYSYGFDGVLIDNFQSVASVSDLSFDQKNEQLELHTFNLVPANSTETFMHNLVRPQYNESWVAHVDITVPAVYESTVPSVDSSRLELGLGIGFGPNAMENGNMATMTLGVEGTAGGVRRIVDAYADNASSLDVADTITDMETVQVTFEYDSKTNTLRARHSAQGPISLQATTQVDWGMRPTDEFDFYLIGSSQAQPVFSSAPMSMDNFEIKIDLVPEPDAGILLLAIGLMAWRRLSVRR